MSNSEKVASIPTKIIKDHHNRWSRINENTQSLGENIKN